MASYSKDQIARHHGFSGYWDFYDTKEANKRRAKERVRKAKQIALGEKLIAIKYKLLEWLS